MPRFRSILVARTSRFRLSDWLIGGLLFSALIIWVHYQVGWAKLLAPWVELPASLLLGLLSLAILSYLFRAARIYDYFSGVINGPFSTILRVSVLHNLANNLLPMRLGETAFPLLMQRYFGAGFGTTTMSLIWIRLLDFHFLGTAALVAVFWFLPSVVASLVLLLWIAGLLLMARFLPWSHARLERTRLAKFSRLLMETAPRPWGRLARAYLWTGLSWGCKLTAFTIVLMTFANIDALRALAGVIGAELSSVLPLHGIAGAGSYEAAGVGVLVLAGITVDQALAGTVNLHLFLLGVTLLLGLLALLLPTRRGVSSAGSVSP